MWDEGEEGSLCGFKSWGEEGPCVDLNHGKGRGGADVNTYESRQSYRLMLHNFYRMPFNRICQTFIPHLHTFWHYYGVRTRSTPYTCLLE